MTNYNFLKYKKFFVSLSTVMTIGCLLIILIKGFNYGVDFKGGTVIEIRTEKNIHVEEIRSSISKLNINNYTVKEFGAANVRLVLKAGVILFCAKQYGHGCA